MKCIFLNYFLRLVLIISFPKMQFLNAQANSPEKVLLNENEINALILGERSEDLTNLQEQMRELQEIFKDFNRIVGNQSEDLAQVSSNTEALEQKIETGVEELKASNELDYKSKVVKLKLALAAALGTCALGGAFLFKANILAIFLLL